MHYTTVLPPLSGKSPSVDFEGFKATLIDPAKIKISSEVDFVAIGAVDKTTGKLAVANYQIQFTKDFLKSDKPVPQLPTAVDKLFDSFAMLLRNRGFETNAEVHASRSYTDGWYSNLVGGLEMCKHGLLTLLQRLCELTVGFKPAVTINTPTTVGNSSIVIFPHHSYSIELIEQTEWESDEMPCLFRVKLLGRQYRGWVNPNNPAANPMLAYAAEESTEDTLQVVFSTALKKSMPWVKVEAGEGIILLTPKDKRTTTCSPELQHRVFNPGGVPVPFFPGQYGVAGGFGRGPRSAWEDHNPGMQRFQRQPTFAQVYPLPKAPGSTPPEAFFAHTAKNSEPAKPAAEKKEAPAKAPARKTDKVPQAPAVKAPAKRKVTTKADLAKTMSDLEKHAAKPVKK
jgi:hypothetical protein